MTEQELRDVIQEIMDNAPERGVGSPPTPLKYFVEALKKEMTTEELETLLVQALGIPSTR